MSYAALFELLVAVFIVAVTKMKRNYQTMLTDYIPGVIAAGIGAAKAVKSYRSVGTQVAAASSRGRYRYGVPGRYTGYTRTNKRPKHSVFASKGCTTESVHRGQVSNEGLVVAGLTAYHTASVLNNTAALISKTSIEFVLASALLRHIVKKEWGWNIQSWDAPINTWHEADVAVNDGMLPYYQIDFYNKNTQTKVSVLAYSLVLTQDQTFTDLAFKLAYSWVRSFDGHNILPLGYALRRKDFMETVGAVSEQYGTALRRLDDLVLSIGTKALMTFQNGTHNDDGTTNADGVGANPTQLTIMEFSGNPVVRDQWTNPTGDGTANPSIPTLIAGAFHTADTNCDGVIIPGTITTNNMVYVPKSYQFRNLFRYRKLNLAPGEIKRVALTFKFTGTLSKLCQYTHVGAEEVTTLEESSTFAGHNRSLLLFAEQLLQTSGVSTRLNYEVNRFARCRVIGYKPQYMPPLHAAFATPQQDT